MEEIIKMLDQYEEEVIQKDPELKQLINNEQTYEL